MSHPVTDTIAGMDTQALPSQEGPSVIVATVLVLGTTNDIA